jgi:hypothetical protein
MARESTHLLRRKDAVRDDPPTQLMQLEIHRYVQVDIWLAHG